MTKRPHIVVSYTQELPAGVFGEFRRTLADDRLDLQMESRPNDAPWVGVEWYLPTAVVIFLTKGYLDGFLKEAGKDHYLLLRRACSSFWETFFGDRRLISLQLVAAGQHKIAKHRKYSLAFSVMAEGSESNFKLLLQENATQLEFDKALEHFLEFARSCHANGVGPEISKQLQEARPVGRTILMAYDLEISALRIVDPSRKEDRE